MKNVKKIVAAAILCAGMLSPVSASAFNIKDLLGDNAISNIVEGVLTKTDISVADMAGTWVIDSPAVAFKSDNALAKAGGVAAAGVIESKIQPYYEKYGLTGGEITINNDGTFSMKLKGMTLGGTITKLNDGNFEFAFTALGITITKLTTYVQKAPSSLSIMFDATKLKTLLTYVAKLSGNSLAGTVSGLLDQYDGLCIGFGMKQTTAAPSRTPSGDNTSDSIQSGGSGIGNLINILKNGKK